VAITVTRAGEERIFTAHVRDITERKRAEEELALGHELSLAIAGAESAELALADVLRAVCERTGWALGQAWVRTADGRALKVTEPRAVGAVPRTPGSVVRVQTVGAQAISIFPAAA
jgi:hypothetical protein